MSKRVSFVMIVVLVFVAAAAVWVGSEWLWRSLLALHGH